MQATANRPASQATHARAVRIAGHAVASLARGVGFRKATIEPTHQLLGVDDYFKMPSRFLKDPSTTPIHQRWIEDRCIIVFAGPAAVALLVPQADDKVNAQACRDIALGLVRSIATSDALVTLHLDWLEAIALDLVTVHRQAVEDIAGRLLMSGILSDQQCRDIWRSFAAPVNDTLPRRRDGRLHWEMGEAKE